MKLHFVQIKFTDKKRINNQKQFDKNQQVQQFVVLSYFVVFIQKLKKIFSVIFV